MSLLLPLVFCKSNIDTKIEPEKHREPWGCDGCCNDDYNQKIKLIDINGNWDKSVDIDSLQVYSADKDWKFTEDHDVIISSCSLPFARLARVQYDEYTKIAKTLEIMFDGSKEHKYILRRNKDKNKYDSIRIMDHKFSKKREKWLIHKLKYNNKEYSISEDKYEDILNILVE